jgi:hypothetical protein
MNTNAPNKDIALKAWDIYQGLAKGMGESAWKIRSVFFTISAAIISFVYTSDAPFLYILVSALSVLFLFLESGYRRMQDQYIEKSNEIELTLNDYIAGEECPRFPESIGTDVETPDFDQLIQMFHLKRAIFWVPYTVLFIVPVLLFLFDITKKI